METRNSCQCCLNIQIDNKDLRTLYVRPGFGVPEVYSVMLANCFGIYLNLETGDECGICEECVGRLRDASDFKLQVQRSQAELRERLQRALQVKDEKPAVLLEMFDDDGTNVEAMLRENQLTCDEKPLVKSEMVCKEEHGTSNDIHHNYLDKKPLVKSEMVCKGEHGTSNDIHHNLEVESAAGPRPAAGGAAPERNSATLGCSLGSGALSRAETLTTHMEEMHTDSAAVRAEEEACTCDTCGERFTDKMHLVQQTKVMDTSYSCNICSEHSHTHKTEVYTCTICDKVFSSKYTLNRHGVVHTGQKPYSCEICNKGFARKIRLTEHIRRHTGEKPYKCEMCDKRFIRNSHLTRHLRTHTEQKPYKCELCDRQFTQNGDLQRHIRIHTGQKPYKCEICNKRFTQPGTLKSHIRMHTGQKPYECDICYKRFTQSSDLTKHNRVHTGQKLYKCEICNQMFTQKGSLNIHLTLYH